MLSTWLLILEYLIYLTVTPILLVLLQHSSSSSFFLLLVCEPLKQSCQPLRVLVCTAHLDCSHAYNL